MSGNTELIEVGGHEVHPEQRSVLPCPVCAESQDVYYLGSRSSPTAGDEPRSYTVSGWLCPGCESTLEITDENMMSSEKTVKWADVIVKTESDQ